MIVKIIQLIGQCIVRPWSYKLGVVLKDGNGIKTTAIGLISTTIIVSHLLFAPKIASAQTTQMQSSIDVALQNISLYQTIKIEEPDIYQQLVKIIGQENLASGNVAATIERAEALITPLFLKRLPKTSDEALWQYVVSMNKALTMLYQKNPQVCYHYLFPTPQQQISINELSSMAELGKTVQESFNQVFLDYDPSRSIPSLEQVSDTLLDVFSELYTHYGDDTELLDAPEGITNPDQQKTLCALTIDLYRNLIDRHDEQATNVLRYIFSEP